MEDLNNKTFLNADFRERDTIWLTNTYTLRKVIGILGMLLPLLLILFMWVDNGLTQPLESISHYYYTRVSGIFTSTLSILAIFLMIYKGNERIDLIFSFIAGIGALLVVFFPTGNISDDCCVTLCSCSPDTRYISVSILPRSEFREAVHYIAAAVFLLCLAFMSIFLFTKSNKSVARRGEMKIIRNRIYRTCGVIMIAAIAIIFIGGFLGLIPEDFYKDHQLTFWMEAVAVESFGFSWLIKGEALFKDK